MVSFDLKPHRVIDRFYSFIDSLCTQSAMCCSVVRDQYVFTLFKIDTKTAVSQEGNRLWRSFSIGFNLGKYDLSFCKMQAQPNSCGSINHHQWCFIFSCIVHVLHLLYACFCVHAREKSTNQNLCGKAMRCKLTNNNNNKINTRSKNSVFGVQ